MMNEPPATLVVVEDDAEIATFVCDFFAMLHMRAISCPPGADTVGCIREHRPDLIILDVDLGTCTGIDVLHQVRADPTLIAVPIIFFSESEDLLRQLLPDYEAYGATFVRKPNIEQLRLVVHGLPMERHTPE
jgi:DNA-binding response OmpR family regulator